MSGTYNNKIFNYRKCCPWHWMIENGFIVKKADINHT